VGPVTPCDGVQAVPEYVKTLPVAGAVAETARPWSCVALPLDGLLIEKNGISRSPLIA
jgi:hypothetical protein